jgi:V-type H+-transporting ATPase subunit G
MASNTHISELMRAEEQAQNTVKEARKEKTDLLKQAKVEADREVHQYRASLEEEYQHMLTQGSTDTGAALQKLNSDTERTIQEMKGQVQQKSGQVASILVDHVKRV